MTKIYAIELNNLSSGIHGGQPIPKGCLNVQIDRLPKFEFYRIHGRTLWAETEDFVSCYSHVPGSRDGFAGREIVLPVLGLGKVFSHKGVTRVSYKGSLWDSVEAVRDVQAITGQKLWSIGVRTGINGCYCSVYAKQSFLDRMAKCIVFGPPEQSPVL